MPELDTSLDRQIACIRREIAMRERVYPKRVADGKMKQHQADDEMAAIQAVLRTLLTMQTEGHV